MYNIHTMSVLKIKHREFEIVQIIKDDVFKCERKDKIYFIKKYNLEKAECRERFNNVIKISHSSVTQPKLKLVDKKNGYVVKEYVEGTLMSDYILDHDFDENIYRQIYMNSYMARVIGIYLDYSLNSWMLVGDTLYYVGDFCDKFTPEKDFTKSGMTMWFMTKDLVNYYEKNGILFDKSRIKEEFVVNKEMVLMTCKYYQ